MSIHSIVYSDTSASIHPSTQLSSFSICPCTHTHGENNNTESFNDGLVVTAGIIGTVVAIAVMLLGLIILLVCYRYMTISLHLSVTLQYLQLFSQEKESG